MEKIEVKGVSKKYGNQCVLKSIDMIAKEGEILGLLGPSGAGKTTIIKSIMGMEKIDSGFVKVLNQTMPNRKALEHIGYMAQSDALYDTLSGRENLEFFGQLFGLQKKKLEERCDAVLEMVDLKKDELKRVAHYSGGMKRRLSLAISLIQNPEILILDEPTVGIDPSLRISIWNELRQLKQQGVTIIMTTHVMDEAMQCDELLLLHEGLILAKGSPKKLTSDFHVSTIEEVFIKAESGETL